MNMISWPILRFVLAGAIAIGFSAALIAWKHRSEPGAVGLTVLLAGQVWWSATEIFRISATATLAKSFWLNLSWIGVSIIPVGWLFFSLEYTGYHQYIRRRYVALAMVVPAITSFLALTGNFHDLLYLNSTLVTNNGLDALHMIPGPWYWVAAVYTYLLGMMGVVPIVGLMRSKVRPFRGQSVALVVALLAPWATNVLYVLDMLPPIGIDPTPIAFSISGVAYLGAFTEYRLLGANPSPIRPARRIVFEGMDQGAIVLDRNDTVVEMNARGAEILDTTRDEALGTGVETALPRLSEVLEDSTNSGQTLLSGHGDNGTYDVSANPMINKNGQRIGRIITFNDISHFVRQQQRLAVLNRVFRHNIRTNVQVIMGNAEYLAHNDSEEKSQKIQEKANEIGDIGDKIRTIIDVIQRAQEGTQPVQLESILGECVDAVSKEHPAVDIEYDGPFDTLEVDSVLSTVFENIIENAAEHNTNDDPTVSISVESGQDQIQVRVEDNGSGINDHELSLVEDGTETALQHGSGLGLAIAAWGVESIGGSIAFEDREPDGTVVTIEVPRYSSAEQPNEGEKPAY